jgi:hypothetical protein
MEAGKRGDREDGKLETTKGKNVKGNGIRN